MNSSVESTNRACGGFLILGLVLEKLSLYEPCQAYVGTAVFVKAALLAGTPGSGINLPRSRDTSICGGYARLHIPICISTSVYAAMRLA